MGDTCFRLTDFIFNNPADYIRYTISGGHHDRRWISRITASPLSAALGACFESFGFIRQEALADRALLPQVYADTEYQAFSWPQRSCRGYSACRCAHRFRAFAPCSSSTISRAKFTCFGPARARQSRASPLIDWPRDQDQSKHSSLWISPLDFRSTRGPRSLQVRYEGITGCQLPRAWQNRTVPTAAKRLNESHCGKKAILPYSQG
jgi:hypothetical protein